MNVSTSSSSSSEPSFQIQYWEVVLLSVICAPGIILNALVIVVSNSRGLIKSKATTLVRSLAVADLLHLAFNWPFNLYLLVTFAWELGETACKFKHFIQMATLVLSVATLTALAHDRCRAVVSPLRATTSPSINKKFISIIIWLLSGCVAIPDAVFSKLVSGVTESGYRYQTCVLNEARLMILTVVIFIISAALVAFFYTRLAIHVLSRNEELASDGTAAWNHQQQRKYRVAKMVFVLIVVFFMLTGPAQIYDSLMYWKPELFNFVVYLLGKDLMIAHSTMNPLMLFCLSTEYKTQLAALLKLRLTTDNGRRISLNASSRQNNYAMVSKQAKLRNTQSDTRIEAARTNSNPSKA